MKDIVLFIWLYLNFLPIVVPALKLVAVRNQKVDGSLIVFDDQGEPFGDQVHCWNNRVHFLFFFIWAAAGTTVAGRPITAKICHCLRPSGMDHSRVV
jgi:hypothetical protein